MVCEFCTTVDFRVRDPLQEGKRVLKRNRVAIATVCISFGIGTGVIYELISRCFHATRVVASTCLLAFLYNIRFLILGFAPLADDKRVTQAVLAVDSCFMIYDTYMDTFSHLPFTYGDEHAEQVEINNGAVYMATSTLFLGSVAWATRRPTATRMQCSMWKAVCVNRIIWSLYGLALLVKCCMDYHDFDIRIAIWCLLDAVLAIVVRMPKLMEAIQLRIRRQLVATETSAAAAGIAALIGNSTINEATVSARSRFRCIRLDKLHLHDLIDSPTSDIPVDKELFERTETCSLGTCDAFLSHSWHDPLREKWDALQRWRVSFVREHGREPWIWFDKASINQRDIEADLNCLPIFLSGSKTLLVLYGPTYLSRLWCIVELFTFVHIGSNQISMEPLVRDALDLSSINQAIAHFDVNQSKCYKSEDKERMLEIILAAFGDMSCFNREVRFLMEKGKACV